MFNKREFLFDSDLHKKIFEVFKSAKREVVIVSPYIRLYVKINDNLIDKTENQNIKMKVAFGKNYKWSKVDVDFIKRFPNVLVIHKENLHAKFYANEHMAISTSLNLLESSFKNNYETGILIEYDSDLAWYMKLFLPTKIIYCLLKFPFQVILWFIMLIYTWDPQWSEIDTLGKGAKNYIDDLFSEKDNIIFEKKTSKRGWSYKSRKQPIEPEIILDRFDEFTQTTGFCIRTGLKIDFNPNQPYSKESYYIWVREGGDRNKKEKYCHRTGKLSNGLTTINDPIMLSSD